MKDIRARVLLAEANQWPDDLVPYFGNGDEFHMAFNFPLMPRMFMAIRRESAKPIIDIMQHMPEIPPSCQWATVSPQSRRTDAGNGDRRRARLYVHASTPRIRACASTRASAAGSRR